MFKPFVTFYKTTIIVLYLCEEIVFYSQANDNMRMIQQLKCRSLTSAQTSWMKGEAKQIRWLSCEIQKIMESEFGRGDVTTALCVSCRNLSVADSEVTVQAFIWVFCQNLPESTHSAFIRLESHTGVRREEKLCCWPSWSNYTRKVEIRSQVWR